MRRGIGKGKKGSQRRKEKSKVVVLKKEGRKE